ncbi:MAG: copper chaperone [Clostridia bacterium]|jgi:copper chaperone|nr:copper chaperone [Clostridia bacterium]MDN5322365.1 copper chaperone [Clostridia bacterium]
MGCCHGHNNLEEKTLKVNGMSCGHCKMSVEKAVNELDGVKSAIVNVDAKSAAVQFDPNKVTLEKIKATIEELGYEVE